MCQISSKICLERPGHTSQSDPVTELNIGRLKALEDENRRQTNYVGRMLKELQEIATDMRP